MYLRTTLLAMLVFSLVGAPDVRSADKNRDSNEPRKLNNLVSELLVAEAISGLDNEFSFTRPLPGWVFVSASLKGQGRVNIALGKPMGRDTLIKRENAAGIAEAFRFLVKGQHRLNVSCTAESRVEKLVVKAIPELIHCGLGFDPAIKSYGRYDMEFLKREVLPNVTTLIVPHNIELTQAAIADWHGQGKRYLAEVGINAQAQTADDHFKYWTGFLDKAPFLDGIIVNEFIVNAPSTRPDAAVSAERQQRIERERQKHALYEHAFKRIRSDNRYKNKTLYAYIGGSGKQLNQEMIGKTFVRALMDCDYRIALERYLFEVSSPQKSADALQQFVDGVADWEAKEPGVKERMVIAFGLFSMPPGSINKQPNVDYHVWMDRQMNLVANHDSLTGIGGLEWWTSTLADEETVRFVGRLYRHYAIDGKTEMLTRDPLFLTHIQNADFEKGTEVWTLRPAEDGTIAAKSFPRYGRIEGRYMGLGRPADPEHIGDTFLWIKRSPKRSNTFSQTIKNLEPGRLYSMKMFTCDYQDLVQPKAKKLEEAGKFIGRIELQGVEVDARRSFTETYASSPEPPIPVWITYHWKIFRVRDTTATLTISDWQSDERPAGPFGQEQTFNFLEIQPYHE
jgi:hypothetical protein